MEDHWEKYYELGCNEFLKKNWKQAMENFLRALNLNSNNSASWKMLALVSVKLGRIRDAIDQIHTCLDLKPGDCTARFCSELINDGMLKQFFARAGKQLTLFDDEIVYTTEDEIAIERGTELDPLKFEKELAFNWHGLAMGKLDEFKSQYDHSDEEIKNLIKHTEAVMAINFKGVEIRPDDRILEIGSGAGRILHILAQNGLIKNTVASDVAVYELQGVRKCFNMVHKTGPMGYVGLLANNLPFKRDSFDVVLIMDVVEHLYHQEFVSMLQGVREIMKASGRLYIQTPNGFRYMGTVKKRDDGSLNIPEMNGNWQHVAEKSMGYLKKTLYECGFKVKVLNRMRYVVKAEIMDDKKVDLMSGDWERTKVLVENLLKQNIWHKSLKILLNYRVKKFDHLSRDFLLENYSSLRVRMCLVMDQGIGNMVMLTPTIRALKSLYPNSFLEVVGKEDSLSVIKGWGLVDKCSDYRNYEFPSDPCIMLLSIWSPEFIHRFRSRLNSFDGPIVHVNIKNPDRHESEYNLDLVRFLGYEGSLPSGHCQKDDVDWPFKADKPVAILSDTTINIPAWQRKRWPYFSSLARELLEKGYQVGLIGGESEAREFQSSKWPEGIINLSGKYTIPQAAHIISKADLFVGNDSGPAHISGVVGTRTIVIFGATREGKNKPLGKRVDIICSDIKCRPCQYTSKWNECKDWQCVKGLSVDDILLRLSLTTQKIFETF